MPSAAPAAAPVAAAPTGGVNAPYAITAPKEPAAKESIVTALGERVSPVVGKMYDVCLVAVTRTNADRRVCLLCWWLDPQVLGAWQGIHMNAKRPAKLVLTTGHFCIQRGNGDVDSGSELFELSRAVSMSKQGSKMMSGWSLSVVVRPKKDAASAETETHKFQM